MISVSRSISFELFAAEDLHEENLTSGMTFVPGTVRALIAHSFQQQLLGRA